MIKLSYFQFFQYMNQVAHISSLYDNPSQMLHDLIVSHPVRHQPIQHPRVLLMQIVQHGFYQLLVQNAVIIFSAQPDRLVNDCMVGLHTDIRICFLQQNLII